MTTGEFDPAFDRALLASLGPKGGPHVTDATDLAELGVDSMEMIKLIMDLEDALGFFWPVDHMAEHERFTVVGVLRRACRRYAGVPA